MWPANAMQIGENVELSVVAQSINSQENTGNAMTSRFSVGTDGNFTQRREEFGVNFFTDVAYASNAPNFSGADYVWFRLTEISDPESLFVAGSSSALATWILASTTPGWEWFKASEGSPNSSSATYTIAMSRDGGSTIWDSATLTVQFDHIA